MKQDLKYFLFIIILISIQSTNFAQKVDIAKASYEVINALKQGVLIVIIPGQYKKIQILEASLKDSKTSKKRKKRISKLIKSAKEERDALLARMYGSFQENYNFSDFAFIYDTATVHILKKGVRKGIFIRDNDKIDLTGKPIFFLRYGYTNRNTTTGIEAWVVADNQFDDLQKPFPYYVAVFRPLREVFSALIFYPSIVTKIGSKKKKIGFAFDKKFWGYYNQGVYNMEKG